jgi:hypothetical protein
MSAEADGEQSECDTGEFRLWSYNEARLVAQ